MSTIHLQGIGLCKAVEAQNLKPGMLLSWNHAPLAYEVIKIEEASEQFIWLTEKNRTTGNIFKRKLKKTRLVAAKRLT
jgi:hypothetical protein